MPSGIEIHDSVVVRCSDHNGVVVVQLSPEYLHRSPDKPGIDAGEVFTLDLDLKLCGGAVRCGFVEIPTRLIDGSFSIAESRFDNVVPFPLDAVASVAIVLIDDHGREITITSQGVSLVPASAETYLEPYPGSDA